MEDESTDKRELNAMIAACLDSRKEISGDVSIENSVMYDQEPSQPTGEQPDQEQLLRESCIEVSANIDPSLVATAIIEQLSKNEQVNETRSSGQQSPDKYQCTSPFSQVDIVIDNATLLPDYQSNQEQPLSAPLEKSDLCKSEEVVGPLHEIGNVAVEVVIDSTLPCQQQYAQCPGSFQTDEIFESHKCTNIKNKCPYCVEVFVGTRALNRHEANCQSSSKSSSPDISVTNPMQTQVTESVENNLDETFENVTTMNSVKRNTWKKPEQTRRELQKVSVGKKMKKNITEGSETEMPDTSLSYRAPKKKLHKDKTKKCQRTTKTRNTKLHEDPSSPESNRTPVMTDLHEEMPDTSLSVKSPKTELHEALSSHASPTILSPSREKEQSGTQVMKLKGNKFPSRKKRIQIRKKPDASQRRRVFDCSVCGKVFTQKVSMIRHKMLHDGMMCLVCGKKFTSIDAMNTHEKTHGEKLQKGLTCLVCGKEFSSTTDMQAHKKQQDGAGKYECCLCGKEFCRRAYWRRHQQMHLKETKFTCPVCGQQYKKKLHLAKHQLSHEATEYTCPVCSKVFTSKYYFQVHQEIHNAILEGNKFICSECGKDFNRLQNLKCHQKMHDAEKYGTKFPCSVCNKEFRMKRNLQKHKLLHSVFNKKRFFCYECGYEYMTEQSLSKHRKRIHDPERGKCPICWKQCNLRAHKVGHRIPKPDCAICMDKITNLYLHMLHNKTSQSECLLCMKMVSELYVHMPNHNRPPSEHASSSSKVSNLQSDMTSPETHLREPTTYSENVSVDKLSHKSMETKCPTCSRIAFDLFSHIECHQIHQSSCTTCSELLSDVNFHFSCHQSFKCKRCPMSFENWDESVSHTAKHRPASAYCPYVPSSESPNAVFQCLFCTGRFETADELDLHINSQAAYDSVEEETLDDN